MFSVFYQVDPACPQDFVSLGGAGFEPPTGDYQPGATMSITLLFFSFCFLLNFFLNYLTLTSVFPIEIINNYF